MFVTGILSLPDLLHRFRSKQQARKNTAALHISQQFDILLARLSPRAREAVTEYLDALQDREEGKGSVERMWLAVAELKDALILDDYGENTTQLERLSEDDFNLLRRTLKGIVINRFETLQCDPDSLFFLDLSRRYGTLADVKFFEFYRQTYPDPKSKWPIYMQGQTDLTGCTDFGNGKLVEIFERWRSFKINHPSDYVVPVKEILENVSQALATSTCACGAKETVERELQSFVQRFPEDALTSAISYRLEKLRSGLSDIRFSCISG